MSIENQRDLVIEAILRLLHGALNASDGLGAGSVLGNYDEPMSLDVIARAQLPALCVYRTSDTGENASQSLIETVSVTIDLFLPPSAASTGTRSRRWPALVNAWTCMRKALMTGHHPAVEGDALILDIADITVQLETLAAKTYGFADNGTSAYPWMRAQFEYTKHITHEVNDSLVRLLRVRTVLDMNTELPTAEERQATVNVEFSGPWPDPASIQS